MILLTVAAFKLLQLLTLFFLMLVTGVFWGLYFSLSRSYHVFSVDELAHIARVIVKNLAVPMRNISITCLLLMGLSAGLYPNKNSIEFYLAIIAIAFVVIALVITTAIEVPINNQVVTWTNDNIPADWEAIRNRWQRFNIIRTIAALAGFLCFGATIVNLF
jgi:uncharacterized membrane protein